MILFKIKIYDFVSAISEMKWTFQEKKSNTTQSNAQTWEGVGVEDIGTSLEKPRICRFVLP